MAHIDILQQNGKEYSAIRIFAFVLDFILFFFFFNIRWTEIGK